MSIKETPSLRNRSALPRYSQLKEIIREEIRSQQWLPGTLLPSERLLVARYGVSRMTVRQALLELVNEGIVYREQGKGTFVKQLPYQMITNRLSGFTELVTMQRQRPGTKLLSAAMWAANEAVATRLRVKPGIPVLRLSRLRYANEKPLALEHAHISFMGCERLLEDDLEQLSLYRLLEEKYGLPLLKAEQEFAVGVLGQEESSYFNLPVGSPAYFPQSVAYTEHDQPVEYTMAVLCGTSLRVTRLKHFEDPLPFLIKEHVHEP